MSTQKYSVTQHPINTLLTWINSGEIAIPEIQRPFVWKPTKVRDLLDSLLNGYPVGYLIAWRSHNVKLKRSPSTTPAGTSTVSRCSSSSWPWPLHGSQVSLHTSPRPPQHAQVRGTCTSSGAIVPPAAWLAVIAISARAVSDDESGST